jgi:quercetin dioxygenase-like cupin family protein
MKSLIKTLWCDRFTVNAIVCLAVVSACGDVALAQTKRPGAQPLAVIELGKLPQAPLYWHLDTYPTRATAEAAKDAHGTVVEVFDRVWLLTLAGAEWRPAGGDHIATIGPIPLGASGANMTASYLQAATSPGFQTDVHKHSGPEALYTLSGEVCVETPQGKQVGRGGGEPLLIAGDQPMQLTSIGTETRRSIVLVVHDSTQSWKIPASDWTPKGLCAGS